MKKIKIVTLSIMILFSLLCLNSFNYKSTTTGAPPGHTGAPDEQTCAKSGCHTGNTINSNLGKLSINLNGLESYELGKTYTISIKMSQSNINRFGFEMVALRTKDQKSSGTIVMSDFLKTQIMQGPNQFSGREYITYRFPGTDPTENGATEWKFDWIAPSQNDGPVTFYAAAIAANNDASDLGDFTYTSTYELKGASTTQTNKISKSYDFRVFPNPVNNQFELKYHLDNRAEIAINLNNIDGTSSITLLKSIEDSGDHSHLFNSEFLTNGMYLLTFAIDKSQIKKKIMIQNK
ncbi:MAG TPA: T9SS type A sorting domain-containing protein [Saprospiraceae bacterium]|nr:T9SS type A sorting domain-containing protein [Saprospiraceae bacterium]